MGSASHRQGDRKWRLLLLPLKDQYFKEMKLLKVSFLIQDSKMKLTSRLPDLPKHFKRNFFGVERRLINERILRLGQGGLSHETARADS